MGVVVWTIVWVARWTILNAWFLAAVAFIALLRTYLAYKRAQLLSPGRINGKTAIVTGANTGLGFEIAKTLASRGARVIMACRNMGGAYQAKANIVSKTGNSKIEVKMLDLSSLWSIRQFVKDVEEAEEKVDLLIHAAAVAGVSNTTTADDLQTTWQINFLGPFLLTSLLLDKLKASKPSRVIFMSSTLHHFHRLNVDKIATKKDYSHFTSWCDTMMATILMSKYLARKLEGTGVTVNTTNPGLVNTRMLWRIKNSWFQAFLKHFLDMWAKTLEEGAASTIMLAVSPEYENVTGKYISDCKESKCLSATAHDMALGERLWAKSVALTDLKAEDKTI